MCVCVCACVSMLACARVHVCETIDANLTRNKATFGKFCNEKLIQTLQQGWENWTSIIKQRERRFGTLEIIFFRSAAGFELHDPKRNE